MYKDTLEMMAERAVSKKEQLAQSKLRYLLGSGLAGAYVGLGIILIFSIGAPLFAAHSTVTQMVMGVSFGISLTLVLFAGSELFTGNNMYFTVSTLAGRTSWRDSIYNWTITWFGNLLGALVLALIIVGSGLFSDIGPDHLVMSTAAKKMSLSYSQLFFRGILCNWLVCLAIWTSVRTKSDTAKLILIWWMLYAFIASGYEHSVANMTLLSLALMLPHPETISLSGWLHNLIPVTLGNMVGGAFFVGTIYSLISPLTAKKGRRPRR